MHGDFAYLNYAPQVDQGLVVDFILPEQLGVVAEVAQEPAQLPHRPGCAVQTAGYWAPDQMFGLEDGEADLVIGFLFVPAETEAIDRALDLVIAEHEKRRLTLAANVRFVKSGVEIKDVYGTLED